MKPGPTMQCMYASLFRRFTFTNVYETGSVKIWKTRHKVSVDIFTVYIHELNRPTVLMRSSFSKIDNRACVNFMFETLKSLR